MQSGIQKLEHPCTLKVKGYCQGTGPHRQFSPEILQKTSILCIHHLVFFKGIIAEAMQSQRIRSQIQYQISFRQAQIIPAIQFRGQRTHHSEFVRWSLLSENNIWSRTLLLYFGLNVNDIDFSFLLYFYFLLQFKI